MRLKLFLALLCGAAGASAAQFENGQSARLIIGQPSFTSERPVSSRDSIGGAGGVAVGANRLFVLDSNRIGAGPVNQRLLIYDNMSQFVPDPVAELDQSSACPACVGTPSVVLGQPDFDTIAKGVEKGFNSPTAVATDGTRLAIADTDNNRVLIWNRIPAVNATPPDVVVGQPDFKTNLSHTDQTGLRGPQGVWFHNGKLIIADTQNGRVLIYNSVPASNGARADVEVGQPDFNTRPSPDLTVSNIKPTANNMLNPITATGAGNRLIVTDLGFNRVVIFNSIPTSNGAAADLVLGQPDMTSDRANNSSKDSPLCPAGSKDAKGEDVFPTRCAATLSFPRFALSDGTRLFIADGGNDRVLIYNSFPASNGAPADAVIGQKDFGALTESNGAESLRAPTALAYDGVNLFVADPFSRRILVFAASEPLLSTNGIVNAASFEVHAQGSIVFDGAPKKDDSIKITIKGHDYTHAAAEGDTLQTVLDDIIHQINEDPSDPFVYARSAPGDGAYAIGGIRFDGDVKPGQKATVQIQDRVYTATTDEAANAINLVDIFGFLINRGNDPDVFADHDPSDAQKLRLTARTIGPQGNSISYNVSLSDGATFTAAADGETLAKGSQKLNLLLVARSGGFDGNNIDVTTTLSSNAGITLTTSGATLTEGNDATQIPAGTQISIFGDRLAPQNATADVSGAELPRELAGAQVYINGVRAPLYFVTPSQINAQMPFEIDGSSASIYVRTRTPEGQVMVSNPRAVTVPRAAPGLFAQPGLEPRAGAIVHGMGFSRGAIAIDNGGGSQAVAAGAVVTIFVTDRTYEYTTVDGDTTDSIRDKLVGMINNAPDPDVEASPVNVGFLSARARITIEGKTKDGDTFTVTVNGRAYKYTTKASDNLVTVANRIITAINAGPGDRDVTARLSTDVGLVAIDIVARALGVEGNRISLTIGLTPNAALVVKSDAKDEKLGGGSTPSAVNLTARRPGKEGDEINYTATANGSNLTATAQTSNLCCGNDLLAPVTLANPAVPGEIIIVFGTGLGLTKPAFSDDAGLATGRKVPDDPKFTVPFNVDDFVSSLAGGKTASVDFVGLMPGQVGIYQINLVLNSDLPDNPMTPVTIAQGLYVSNVVTFPVRNRTPRRATQ